MTISDFHLSDGRKVSLQGRIDRRDRVILDGRQVERVIDYKTGHVNLSSTHNRSNTLTSEEYTSRYFQPGNKLKEGFQGYMYTLLLQGTQAEDTGIMAGFYSARRFGEGIVWVRDGRPVPADVMEAFRARLRSLMEEILDIDTPFRQNMDAAAYQYSAFAGLVP